ncbi:unnamed protein product [Caenorhabditis bovis]|uniref:Uncharacterized protein n=1 Tax=Caenorhabditis bovis TaxID=2654633 RepID=A0A8S1EZH2_9PELO|nr:unnamed protein product [Caenorhabditis bovis]
MFKSTMGFSSTPLDALGQFNSINAVPSPGIGFRAGSPMLSSTYEQKFQMSKFVDFWKPREIMQWIEGLGEEMNPYLGIVRQNVRSGRQLSCLDDETLKKIGISGLGARKTILQAVSLLLYFCHESEAESLQRISHRVINSCTYLEKTMQSAMRMRERANRRADIVNILNRVSSAVLQLSDNVKRLVFWLDRTPFDDIPQYIEMRNQISSMMWNLLRNVNVQPKALFETGTHIIDLAKTLGTECMKIFDSSDPLVIYGTYNETATLKRKSDSINWGLNIQSSFRGVHVISEIKDGSPADACTKVDAGDEILVINKRAVIGWDLTSVAQLIGALGTTELNLIVKRRPKEPQLLKSSKLAIRIMSPASQSAKIYSTDPAGDPFTNLEATPISRHRSYHTISEVVKENTGKRDELRRASIASGAPRHELQRAEDSQVSVDGEEEALIPRIAKRTRTMRHQPDGYVRSFIDNKLVCDIEDDVVNDQQPYNVKCPTEFAVIMEVERDELARMNIPSPKITDDDWKAPFQEYVAPSYRAPNTSGLSGLDSPRRVSGGRMTSSVEEANFGVLPSPSTSSMNSVSSPAHFNRMTPGLGEFPNLPTPDELPGSPGVANYAAMEKLFEGWVKRRKTRAELSANEVTNKWPKCWMCLRGHYLLLYNNQYSKRPDIIINLSKAVISDSTDLKTSKKNIFRISCSPMEHHFSCLSSSDLKNWIQKMKMAKEIFTNASHQRAMSQCKRFVLL